MTSGQNENLESDVLIYDQLPRNLSVTDQNLFLSPTRAYKTPQIGGALSALQAKIMKAYDNAGLEPGAIIVQNAPVNHSQISHMSSFANLRQHSNRSNFSQNHGLLIVNVKEAKITKIFNMYQKQSIYVEIEYQGQSMKTKVNNLGGKNPHFQQTLEMPVPNNSDKILIYLKDECLANKQDHGLIGIGEVLLRKIKNEDGPQWFILNSSEGKQTGSIYIEFFYIPPLNQNSNHILSHDGLLDNQNEYLNLKNDNENKNLSQQSQDNFNSGVNNDKIESGPLSAQKQMTIKEQHDLKQQQQSPVIKHFSTLPLIQEQKNELEQTFNFERAIDKSIDEQNKKMEKMDHKDQLQKTALQDIVNDPQNSSQTIIKEQDKIIQREVLKSLMPIIETQSPLLSSDRLRSLKQKIKVIKNLKNGALTQMSSPRYSNQGKTETQLNMIVELEIKDEKSVGSLSDSVKQFIKPQQINQQIEIELMTQKEEMKEFHQEIFDKKLDEKTIEQIQGNLMKDISKTVKQQKYKLNLIKKAKQGTGNTSILGSSNLNEMSTAASASKIEEPSSSSLIGTKDRQISPPPNNDEPNFQRKQPKKRYKSNPHQRPLNSNQQKYLGLDVPTKIESIQKNIEDAKKNLQRLMNDNHTSSKEKLPEIKKENYLQKENLQLRNQLKMLNIYLDDVCQFIKDYNIKKKKPQTKKLDISSVIEGSSSSLTNYDQSSVDLPMLNQQSPKMQKPQNYSKLLKQKDEEIKNEEKMMKNFFAEYEQLQRNYQKISDPQYQIGLKRKNQELDIRMKTVEKEKRVLQADFIRKVMINLKIQELEKVAQEKGIKIANGSLNSSIVKTADNISQERSTTADQDNADDQFFYHNPNEEISVKVQKKQSKIRVTDDAEKMSTASKNHKSKDKLLKYKKLLEKTYKIEETKHAKTIQAKKREVDSLQKKNVEYLAQHQQKQEKLDEMLREIQELEVLQQKLDQVNFRRDKQETVFEQIRSVDFQGFGQNCITIYNFKAVGSSTKRKEGNSLKRDQEGIVKVSV
eukprot:403337582